MRDLEEAIELFRAASQLHPSERLRPLLLISALGLGLCLSNRYDNQEVVADLEEAVMLKRPALEYCPPGRFDRCIALGDLAHNLRKPFWGQAAIHGLEEVIELLHTALELCPSGHRFRR